jgi:hypothetical protein
MYRGMQRLMNIKIAKAYRTTSNEALCISTGTTPTEIKAQETTKLYRITRDRQNHQLDREESRRIGSTRQTQSVSASKTKKRNTRFKYSLMEEKRARSRIGNR